MERLVETTVEATVGTEVVGAAMEQTINNGETTMENTTVTTEVAVEEVVVEEAVVAETTSDAVVAGGEVFGDDVVTTEAGDAAATSLNRAIRTLVGDNGAALQKVMDIKHYNIIYKFLKKGQDLSIGMLEELAEKTGFKAKVVFVEANDDYFDNYINSLNVGAMETLVEALAENTKHTIKELSAEAKAAKEAAKAEKAQAKLDAKAAKVLAKHTREAEKLASKEAAKAEKFAAKEAAKAEAKAIKDAAKAEAKAIKDAAAAEVKAAKDAEKAAAKAIKDAEKAAAAEAKQKETIAIPGLVQATPEVTLSDLVVETNDVVEELVTEDDVSATDGISIQINPAL